MPAAPAGVGFSGGIRGSGGWVGTGLLPGQALGSAHGGSPKGHHRDVLGGGTDSCSWDLLMLPGAPGPTSIQPETSRNCPKGNRYRDQNEARPHNGKSHCHPPCVLFFDLLWCPLGFSNLAPTPHSPKKSNRKSFAGELVNL